MENIFWLVLSVVSEKARLSTIIQNQREKEDEDTGKREMVCTATKNEYLAGVSHWDAVRNGLWLRSCLQMLTGGIRWWT